MDITMVQSNYNFTLSCVITCAYSYSLGVPLGNLDFNASHIRVNQDRPQ